MLTLGTKYQESSDIIKIPPIILSLRNSKNNSKIQFDLSQLQPDTLTWPEFHNVNSIFIQGVRLCFTNTII
jgi:hypothetical protein